MGANPRIITRLAYSETIKYLSSYAVKRVTLDHGDPSTTTQSP